MAVDSRIPAGEEPLVVSLSSARHDWRLVGRQAARLSVAAAHDLPVLPGFVVTSPAVARLLGGRDDVRPVLGALRARWYRIRDGGWREVAVRQSWVRVAPECPVGRLVVCPADSWNDLVSAALDMVTAGRRAAGVARGAPPLALTVQGYPQVCVHGAGFGGDPVSGSAGRVRLVAAQPWGAGGADRAGVLDEVGPMTDPCPPEEPGRTLNLRERRAVRHLVRQVGRVFGGAPDVDWLVDVERNLWLLECRDLRGCPG